MVWENEIYEQGKTALKEEKENRIAQEGLKCTYK